MRRLVPAAAAALLGSALTAAAITVPAWADGSEDSRERLQRWERCLREQGFDVGGSTVVRITDDGVTIDGEAVDPERFRAAEARCGRPFALPRDEGPDLGEAPDARRPLERALHELLPPALRRSPLEDALAELLPRLRADGEVPDLRRLPLERALDELLPELRADDELPDLRRLPLDEALDDLLAPERRGYGEVPAPDELPDAFGELEDFFGAPPGSGGLPDREPLPRIPFLPFGERLDDLPPPGARPDGVDPDGRRPELPEELVPPLRCVEVSET